MDKSRAVEKQLPLTEATFYILVALMEPQHGYAVMQDVEAMSHGTVKLGPGTLYGAFTNKEKSNMIRKVGEIERRKIYVITEFGQNVLDKQVGRLKVMARSTQQKRTIVGKKSSEG
jgi:DNA-binding PadR family transcriptional regulator